MNSLPIHSIFEQWWRDSYGITPGRHAVMTHVAFAEHLLDLIKYTEPRNTEATDAQ